MFNLKYKDMPTFSFDNAKKKENRSNIHGTYGSVYKNANIPYGYFSVYGNKQAVYGIKSKTSGKQYVGSTKHIQRRLLKHFNELFHNRHRTKLFQEEFNKYGLYDFEIIIYDNDVNTKLLDKEKEIQIAIGINNLYNEKISGYYITEKQRNILINTSKESHKTKEYRAKMSALKTNKIAQYRFDGKLIKIWDSAVQICATLGYTRSVILCCCNGSKPHAYGFDWRYVDDDGNILKSGYIKARKKQ